MIIRPGNPHEELEENEKKELEKQLAEERNQIECEVYGTLPENYISDEDIWEYEMQLKSACRMKENSSNTQCEEIIVIE